MNQITREIVYSVQNVCGGEDMKTAGFYQSTADAIGVPLYVYPDGSVTNLRRVGVEPIATIEPHQYWKPPEDHGLGEQLREP
jgi:hypothetical protein